MYQINFVNVISILLFLVVNAGAQDAVTFAEIMRKNIQSSTPWAHCRINVNCMEFIPYYKNSICMVHVKNPIDPSRDGFCTGFLVETMNNNYKTPGFPRENTPPMLLTVAHSFEFTYGGLLEPDAILSNHNVEFYFDYEETNCDVILEASEGLLGQSKIKSAKVLSYSPHNEQDFMLLLLNPKDNWKNDFNQKIKFVFHPGCAAFYANQFFSTIHHEGATPKQYSILQSFDPPVWFGNEISLFVLHGMMYSGSSGSPVLAGDNWFVGYSTKTNSYLPYCPNINPEYPNFTYVQPVENILPHCWGWLMPEDWQNPAGNPDLVNKGIQSVNNYCHPPVSKPPSMVVLNPFDIEDLGITQNSISGWAADEDGIEKVVISVNDRPDPIICQGQESWHCDHVPIVRSSDNILTITTYDNNGNTSAKKYLLKAVAAVKLASFDGYKVDNGYNRLEWETGSETNNLGFYLYRNTKNDFATATQLEFIPARSLPGFYKYDDTACGPNPVHYYWLRDLDSLGELGGPYGPVEIKDIEINISQNGRNIPNLSGVVDFGSVNLGGSKALQFHLENLGDFELDLTGEPLVQLLLPTGFLVANYPQKKIPASSYSSFRIVFSPPTLGQFCSVVQIPNEDYDEDPYTFQIKGTATAPPPEINVMTGEKNIPNLTGSYDFGTIVSGQQIQATFTIENRMDASESELGPLWLNSTPLIGIEPGTMFEPNPYFKVIQMPDKMIDPNTTSTFIINFEWDGPTGLVNNIANARVVIPNNDLDESPYVFQITGRLDVSEGGEEEKLRKISEMMTDIPDHFALHQNYPNPFNAETIISFQLPQAETVRLDIYNIQGKWITRLIDGFMSAGYHHINWNTLNDQGHLLTSGNYFYRITAGNETEIRKMTLLK